MLQIITTEFGNAHDWLFTGGKITVENRWRVKCLKFFGFPFSSLFSQNGPQTAAAQPKRAR